MYDFGLGIYKNKTVAIIIYEFIINILYVRITHNMIFVFSFVYNENR